MKLISTRKSNVFTSQEFSVYSSLLLIEWSKERKHEQNNSTVLKVEIFDITMQKILFETHIITIVLIQFPD